MLSLAEKLAIAEMDFEYGIIRKGDGYAFGEGAIMDLDSDKPQRYRIAQRRQKRNNNNSDRYANTPRQK